MGQYANKTVHKGADVLCRLYKGGNPLDIIEAETCEWQPKLATVDSAPLSAGRTLQDTFVDGVDATVKGVKKGNAFLVEIRDAVMECQATGKPLPKYTVQLEYKDVNTGQTEKVKIADATILEIDAFASGNVLEKQSEGFKVHGVLSK